MTFGDLIIIDPYRWDAIFTAIFCGTIIGLERQFRGKPVGIRTSSLIVLGTYLFLATAFMLKGDIVDPSRVVGQVITGIGFLGAGVMLAKMTQAGKSYNEYLRLAAFFCHNDSLGHGDSAF